MPDDNIEARFGRDGFLHLKSVFSPAEIARLRASVEAIFDRESPYAGDVNGDPTKFSLRINFCARYPELRWIMMHPGLLAPLRTLLGDDFVFLPEMAAHACGYGNWHKDTSSQERDGHLFHWEGDFRMIQVAIYLQDNTDAGGGLTVMPGSHLKRDALIAPHPLARARNIARRLTRPVLPKRIVDPGSYQIPSRTGDLVMFHFRLDHKATTPRLLRRPPERKLVLFFACSANNEHARRYREYIQGRSTYLYLKETPLYPPELLELAREHRLTLME